MEDKVPRLVSAPKWERWIFQSKVSLRAKGLYDIVVWESVKPQVGEENSEKKLKVKIRGILKPRSDCFKIGRGSYIEFTYL